MNKNKEKSPYATLSASPIASPEVKKKDEPKATKTVAGGDLRAKGGK